MLRSLATFLKQALSITGDDSSSPRPSWYMSSVFISSRAHKSFDAIFDASPASRPPNVVWEPGAVPSEEQFVGAFPLADAGVDDGFSLQMLSGLQSAVSAGSGSTSIRLKHISVRFPLAVYPDFAQFHLTAPGAYSASHYRCYLPRLRSDGIRSRFDELDGARANRKRRQYITKPLWRHPPGSPPCTI